jgi:hypothetical protein
MRQRLDDRDVWRKVKPFVNLHARIFADAEPAFVEEGTPWVAE